MAIRPIVYEKRVWTRDSSAVFFQVMKPFGRLSNMSNECNLELAGVAVGSSEALYQMLKYPHVPDAQRAILQQASPMSAKMQAKRWKQDQRKDWMDLRVDVMAWVLRVKLAQNLVIFGKALRETARGGVRLDIVEQSRGDDFWGAKLVVEDERYVLRGANVLGQLLSGLRDELLECGSESMKVVPDPRFPEPVLLGCTLGEVRGRWNA